MIGHVAWIDAAAGVASSRELAGIASILRWSMRKAPDDVSTRKGTASEPTDPMPSGRSIRVRTTSRAHAVCSARDWKPRTMRRQRGCRGYGADSTRPAGAGSVFIFFDFLPWYLSKGF